MADFIKAAFDKVCREAESAEERFVSLYERTCKYGGPEEGGWWRHDVVLVSTAKFPTLEVAERVAKKIEDTAKSMSDESRRRYSERCSRECDWCEERGLDADYLGEPDGPSEYFVAVEEVAGSKAYRAPTHYE